jgi:DNA invertase Pin-like site-specific DNA recombinase
MFIRAYLRASTDQQDATRAKVQLQAFAKERELKVASFYTENVSGASLQRPELFRLLEDSHPGDIVLLEQVDRLSRLTTADWERLKAEIKAKGVRIVALDLPTSWSLLTASQDDFTSRMVAAINDMLLDMLAAIARKDYEDRRRRQAQGIEKAKTAGLYRGRQENTQKNEAIMALLREGKSWSQVQALVPVSKATLATLSKRLKETATARTAIEQSERCRGGGTTPTGV